MLRELRIRHFAVVDELGLELGPGLTVLSGETGAGKSIVIEALGVLMGGRPSAEMIRAGEGKAIVEGRFEIEHLPATLALCGEAGIDAEEGWLILRRELRREGRNRAWVNGSPSTTSLLRELGSTLLDLHGQGEHRRLLDRTEQRRMLDAFGGHAELVAGMEAAWEARAAIEEELEAARETARRGRERADYLRFKAEEIEAAAIEPGEEEALEVEANRLSHSEELLELAGGLHEELYEAEGSIVERLGEVGRRLRDLVAIDASGRAFVELHETSLHALEELGRGLAAYRDAVEHDPARLAEVRERMDLFYRLRRKYGDTIEEVARAGEEARRELDAIEGVEGEIERLEKAREEAEARVAARAAALRAARSEAARGLEAAVAESLPALGLEGGSFAIELAELETAGRAGSERVEFLISLNPGFPPAPLNRVASGGEMSRLMLALETALVSVDEVPVLLFDEVDAGIGGEVAHRVAERLARVAAEHQVIVVTHLAQIASRADAHVSVGKEKGGGETRTTVRELTREERVREVARMLGGDPESDASRAHAEELLAGRL